jgi:hypothetical protein
MYIPGGMAEVWQMRGAQLRRSLLVSVVVISLIIAGHSQARGTVAGHVLPPAMAQRVQSTVTGVQSIFNNQNIRGVSSGPTAPTVFTIARPFLITLIMDYHWNNGRGQPGGTIGLQSTGGRIYGPWKVLTSGGQGGAPNVNWSAMPYVVIPAGTYTIVDSSPATWSQNVKSGGRGFSMVQGAPAATPAVTPTAMRAATPTAIPANPLHLSATASKSVAESNTAVLRVAGYLESGKLQAFVDSLSLHARALLGRSVHMSVDTAAKVGRAMKSARVTAASVDFVFYSMVVDRTTYTFDMVKEAGTWKLNEF